MNSERNIATFNQDVVSNQGYLYTTAARLSSRMANQRLTDATLDLADLRGKRVLDIGCGDGTYTVELAARGQVAAILGVDPAAGAIEVARQRGAGDNVQFSVHGAYELPCPDDSFEVAVIRGVLHHLDRPFAALCEAFRVAPEVIVLEPNGYNPVLKLLERFSRYHRDHDEKSYSPKRLDRWIEHAGGSVSRREWVGLVPFFCPDWSARFLRSCEPLVEAMPLLNRVGCGVYAFAARRQR